MSGISKVIWLAIVVATVASCDSAIYADDELRAQRRFGTIEVGQTEASLVSFLGPPQGVATRATSGVIFEDRSHESSRKLELPDDDRAHWPETIRFMPERSISAKVLVYTDVTVTAYYFIGLDGRVEYVSVFTT